MRRAWAAVAAILVVAAASTACGGGSADAPARVRAAAGKTAAAQSARFSINVSFSGTAVKGDGVVDLGQRRGTVSLDLGALSGLFGGGAVEAVLDSAGIFVKLPTPLPGSKPWLRLDLAALGQSAGVNIGSLGQLQSADPSQALTFLEGAADDMVKVGEEKVRGAATTHYRGTLDLNQAALALPADARTIVDQAAESLGTSTFPADVWLDGDGRMRKLRFEVDSDGSGPATPAVIEFELYEFGVKADVQVPPADQVSDLSSVLGKPK